MIWPGIYPRSLSATGTIHLQVVAACTIKEGNTANSGADKKEVHMHLCIHLEYKAWVNNCLCILRCRRGYSRRHFRRGYSRRRYHLF